MNSQLSFFSDFKIAIFTPKKFFNERFSVLPQNRLFLLGFLGMFLGLLVGSIISLVLTNTIVHDLAANKELYNQALSTLGLNEQSFIKLMNAQKAYSLLLLILSPLICYMAPHILGGALYIFLYLLVRAEKHPINFGEVLLCTSASLTSMAWYMIPVFGPMIAIVVLSVNLLRSLVQQFKVMGFMVGVSIFSALYISFFLTSATLQLLAQSFEGLF